MICYAAILALSLFAASRAFNEHPWIGTTLATIALLAAGTGVWFTLLQIFAIGEFCRYCIVAHLCGLVIAGLILWSALGKRQPGLTASRSHVALAAAMPGLSGARRTVAPVLPSGPSWMAAWPIAGALLVILIAVQVLFPPKTFHASTPTLAATIDMTEASDTESDETDELSPGAQPHVVNRVADGESTADRATSPEASNAEASDAADSSEKAASGDEKAATDAEPADEAPALTREVKFLQGKVRINSYDEAILGSPDAKFIVIEMMDYTCPHCRKMHSHIREALERYGDQLAVVIMPVPLELECNKQVGKTDPMHRGACKMSKVALSVSKVDPVKFIDFHNFLLANEEKAPTAAQAVVRAFRLVDRKALSKLTGSDEIARRVQKYISLYMTLSAQHQDKDKSFGLPVQIVGDTVLTGGEVTNEEMFEAWEKALGIKPL
jgi:protein-disulfide isomerase